MAKNFNLTIPQNNIWLVENFYSDKTINIISGTFTIKTGFILDIAKKTVNKFVELNDATRLKFVVDKGVVSQYLADYEPFDVRSIDISNMSSDECSKLKRDLINEPIDISINPFNFILLDRKDGYGEFLLKTHHLICDAWSVSKMGTDLETIYENILNNGPELEKRPSYIDFITEENLYLNSDKYFKDKEFWTNYLNNLAEPSYLKKKDNLSTRATRFHKVLSTELSKKINEFCKDKHLSVYSVFLSSLATYIHRVTGNTDIIIGTPVLNRSNFKQKQTQGMFVSTVPVRFKFEEDLSFVDLCMQTALNSIQIFKHQKYPYKEIVKGVQDKNSNGENLFNIAFSYQNARADINLDKYNIDWIFNGHTQEELELHVLDLNDSGNLEFDIDYLLDVFSETEIKYLYERILAIIQDGIDNNSNISNIKIMSDSEMQKIINIFNNTVSPYESTSTIIELFEKSVKAYSNAPALILDMSSMSYKELDEKSNSVAWFLHENGIKYGDRIGILVDKSFELLVSIIGVLKCGACYVPIDDNYNLDRKKYILNESNVKLCLVDSLQDFECRQFNIKDIDCTKTSNYICDNIMPTTPVCILYTSGTTGNPKGVEIINRNVIKLVRNIKYMDFPKDARILQVASTVFDLSIFEFWASLLNGKTLCLIKKENLLNFSYLKNYIDSNHINIMCITSVLFNQIVNNHINVFENIKQILTGGDKISIPHVKKLLETYPKIKLYNSYGPTECTSFCTMYKVEDTSLTELPIGKPISNSSAYVLDNCNRLLPLYCIGELAIGGDGVSNGYINNISKNKEVFIENKFNDQFIGKKIYKTGDLVQILDDGNIEFIGRKDNQIKIRGYRIELDEIKSVALKYDDVENCAVVVKEDSKNKSNKKILLYFTARRQINTKLLLQFLRKNLQSYMVPSGILQINEIPLNANYKLDISKLPEISNISNTTIVKPSTDVQIKLYNIIHELLNVDFSIEDNLFSVGLDSLSAIELSNYIDEIFNVSLSTKDILENNTILDLEEYLKDHRSETSTRKTIKQNISSGEKSVFLEWLKNPSNTLYNAPFELSLDKSIDIELLKKSILDTIYNNNNMLSEFSLNNDVITKNIAQDTTYDIDVIKLSLEEYKTVCKNFIEPFNLSHFPLFKIKIYVLEDIIKILMDIHHIIFDGTSFAVFLKEICDRYNGISVINKKDLYFEQYTDVNKLEKAKNFFLTTFDGDLPVNDLPYDRPRKKDISYKGDSIQFLIDKENYKKIDNYIKNNSVTLNSLFQSAFSILLAKYVYNEDIILGMAISGRDSKKLENAIGMFVKTLPYRTKIDWNDTISSYIKKSQNSISDVIDNSSYTYDTLVKDLELQRSTNRNLLFDVMFVCQTMHLPEFKLGNSVISFAPVQRATSKFDLTCEVVPQIDKYQVNFEYATDLFNKLTIKNLGNHFLNIVNFIVSNPDKKLSDIEMISQKEKEKIISFNDNKTDFPKLTVHEIFEKRASENPNKKAIVFEGNCLTYKELNEKANKLARYFISNGLEQGDIVSIMIDKSLDYMPAAIAVLKCGAAYTPIIEDLPDERAKYMIENAKSKLIVTTKQFYRNISDTKTLFIDNEDLYKDHDSSNLDLNYDIDDLLHIIYTSGSTGLPKGNMIKHRGMVRLLFNSNCIDYTSNDVMLNSTSLTFDLSGFEVWAAMMYGMTLHIITKAHIMDTQYYADYLKNNPITTTFLATPIFHLMVEENVKMFQNMRTVYVAGETLLPKYANKFFETFPNIKLYNAYGPAEDTVACTYHLINKLYKSTEDIPIGKVMCNNTIYILDKCNHLCPINVPGELCIWGDGLASGYISQEKLTSQKFTIINNFHGIAYKTGDLSKWNYNGELRFISRIDTQIKIRGQRIELSEIQNKILELKDIKEVVVIIREHDEKKYIVGYYTSDDVISNSDIIEYLKKYLPIYMIPYKLVKIDKMPYNQNGKIARKKLPDISFDDTENYVLPENKKEELILNSFKKVLKNNNIFMNSDFFEVGGDSLMASKLVAELQNKNIHISYSDVFKYKSPSDIYQYVFMDVHRDVPAQQIKNINFSNLHDLLMANIYTGENVLTIPHIGNVLLTGVTGFLGVHILKELVDNPKVDKIFCLVREKDNLSTDTRFREQLNFFFDKNTVECILHKAEVINGDITIPNIFIEPFITKIDVVINSAAYVKHYGDYKKFYQVNVLGVQNIINYCKKNNAKLIQMSTLSVSGNIIESGQNLQVDMEKNTVFDESSLYIKQNIENAYVNTKFIAEVKILEAIVTSNLKANIIRLGNLTGRLSDGKFQPNVADNAFSNRIKTLTLIKSMSNDMYNKYIEMTPIDVVASAINKIIEIDNRNIVYHLFNHNHIPMPNLVSILKSLGCKVNILNKEDFIKLIKEYLNSEDKLSLIQGIIPDISKDGILEYNDTAIIKSEISQSILTKVNFQWPVLDNSYLLKYLAYLQEINFINLNGGTNE